MKQYDYETSEFFLYQNDVMREAGMLEEALKHLEKYEGEIFDHLSVQDTKGDKNIISFYKPFEFEMYVTVLNK